MPDASTTITQKLTRTLQGERTDPPPIWLMRQAGRYLPEYQALREREPNFVRFCFSPELAIEATLQPLRRFDLDAAILFADILLIPHAVDARVEFVGGVGPRIEPVRALADIERLNWDGAAERLSAVFDTVRGVRAELAEDKALIGFAGGPWTVATYMAGGGGASSRQDARIWAWVDRAASDALVERLAAATADYLIAQARAGANVLKLFESWAEALAPPLFERLVVKPTAKIVSAVRAAGVTVPIIGFPRGCGPLVHRYASETGVDAVALDMSLADAWSDEALPAGTPIQAGVDPAVLIAGGEALESEARRILGQFAGRPHVFNLGHGIWPQTPPEHVGQLVELVKSWRP